MQYRIKFAKQGTACYISHLDLMRTWERALRRAGWDLAFSEGFNPHPKISFAQALAVGVSSQAEYVDIGLTHELDCEQELNKLNAVLPEGIKAVLLSPLPEKEAAAMAQVTAAGYVFKGKSQQSCEMWEKGVQTLAEQKELLVIRNSKKGPKEIDIADFIIKLAVKQDQENRIVLCLLASAGSRGNLRPQEVLAALEKYAAVSFTGYDLQRVGLYRSLGKKYEPLLSCEVE